MFGNHGNGRFPDIGALISDWRKRPFDFEFWSADESRKELSSRKTETHQVGAPDAIGIASYLRDQALRFFRAIARQALPGVNSQQPNNSAPNSRLADNVQPIAMNGLGE